MSIIEVKDLHKNYGDLKAVDGISFAVEEGEVFGILGPNGAGKTTTLEILEGLKKADSGQAFIGGIETTSNPQDVKKMIGVQLQSESFYDSMSLVEILELFASFYGKEIDAYKALADVDLLDKAESEFDQMSGGQQRRFSIAAAFVHNPKVLFLDEPTTGLDPQSRRYIWDLIKKFQAGGTTIVLTSHYMEEAQYLCNRLAVIDHGKIVAIGTPDELINDLPVKNVISFEANKEIANEELLRLYGVSKVHRTNGTYYIESMDEIATLYRLLQENFDSNIGIANLNLRRPTLEDVFLHLTGRSLRE